jgi:hypothetical protein
LNEELIKKILTIPVASLCTAFAGTLLYTSLFYFAGTSRNPFILDFFVPFVCAFIVSFFLLMFLTSKYEKLVWSVSLSSILGIVVGLLFFYLPSKIKLASEIIENGNKWGTTIFLGAILAFALMTIISIFVECYLFSKKGAKLLMIAWKVLLFYFVLFLTIIVSGTLWGVMTNPLL